MKLPRPLLLLPCLLFALRVLGSKLAGPYQTLVLWYAYQLDISVHNAVSNWPITIAPGCKGMNKGTCYFDEFVDYIQKQGKGLPSPTGVGTDLEPDVVSAAKKLSNTGYVANYDTDKIFAKGTFATTPNLATLFNKVTDQIQAARIKVNGVGVTDYVNGIQDAFRCVHENRLADNAPGLIANLNSELGYKVDEQTKSGFDGSSWTDIDEVETTKNHPNFPVDYQRYLDSLNDPANPVPNSNKAKKQVKMHYNAVQGVSKQAQRIASGTC